MLQGELHIDVYLSARDYDLDEPDDGPHDTEAQEVGLAMFGSDFLPDPLCTGEYVARAENYPVTMRVRARPDGKVDLVDVSVKAVVHNNTLRRVTRWQRLRAALGFAERS